MQLFVTAMALRIKVLKLFHDLNIFPDNRQVFYNFQEITVSLVRSVCVVAATNFDCLVLGCNRKELARLQRLHAVV